MTQFASRGRLAATDEFIELYNATDKVLTLDGAKVQQQTASCGAWSNRYVVPAGTRRLKVLKIMYQPEASGRLD